MTHWQFVRVLGVCLGLVLAGACSRTHETPDDMNRVLGEGFVGAPVSLPAADPGILQDPTTYTPAPGVATRTAAAAAAREAAPELMDRIVEHLIVDVDVQPVFDLIDPTMSGPIATDEVQSALVVTFNLAQMTLEDYKAEIGGAGYEALAERWEQVSSRLQKQNITNLFEYNAVSPDEVEVSIDPTRLDGLLADVLAAIVGVEGDEGMQGDISTQELATPILTVVRGPDPATPWVIRPQGLLANSDAATITGILDQVQEGYDNILDTIGEPEQMSELNAAAAGQSEAGPLAAIGLLMTSPVSVSMNLLGLLSAEAPLGGGMDMGGPGDFEMSPGDFEMSPDDIQVTPDDIPGMNEGADDGGPRAPANPFGPPPGVEDRQPTGGSAGDDEDF